MMKLLLAVIATCALVVSPTCIKIKHQLRSNAPTIHVLISNGNTQMTSQVGRNGSHRFITDNLSSMTLAPAGSQTIQLSYDEIFPITNAAICTEVHPLSAGGCADGVCCKVSISLFTITDAIIMTARVNNRNADGNPQFWRCEQEIQVPGVTNTELSAEELVTEILENEDPYTNGYYKGICVGEDNECSDESLTCAADTLCGCVSGYENDDDSPTAKCQDINECNPTDTADEHECPSNSKCTDGTQPAGSYTCTCNDLYYGDGLTGSALTCTSCVTCDSSTQYCSDPGTATGTSTCCKTNGCTACVTCDTGFPGEYCSNSATSTCCAGCTDKLYGNTPCTANGQCISGDCKEVCVTDRLTGVTTCTGNYKCTCNDNAHCSNGDCNSDKECE